MFRGRSPPSSGQPTSSGPSRHIPKPGNITTKPDRYPCSLHRLIAINTCELDWRMPRSRFINVPRINLCPETQLKKKAVSDFIQSTLCSNTHSSHQAVLFIRNTPLHRSRKRSLTIHQIDGGQQSHSTGNIVYTTNGKSEEFGIRFRGWDSGIITTPARLTR